MCDWFVCVCNVCVTVTVTVVDADIQWTGERLLVCIESSLRLVVVAVAVLFARERFVLMEAKEFASNRWVFLFAVSPPRGPTTLTQRKTLHRNRLDGKGHFRGGFTSERTTVCPQYIFYATLHLQVMGCPHKTAHT